MMPVQGGVRKRRVTAPKMNGTIISYNSTQTNYPAVANGYTGEIRRYIPGAPYTLANSTGAAIVAQYSTAKFIPGTTIRWEPSVSFNTTGRVFVGFTDNPEVVTQIETLFGTAISTGTVAAWADYLTAIKGLGSCRSFPVWQETEVSFPTRLRRKMFDTNETVASSPDTLDRCMQTCMFVGVEGYDKTSNPGGFWFHDKLEVEGIHARLT